MAAHWAAVTVEWQVENVTILVLALVGFHAVLHQTFIEYPSMFCTPEVEPLPQHTLGGLAFSVWLVESSGV